MADWNVIADVSETLRALLDQSLDGSVLVHDLNPPHPTPVATSLFMFEVCEDASARNRPRRRGVTPNDLTLRKPTMALLLKYLITPWGGDAVTDHQLLGQVLQSFYDRPILSGNDLQGGLAGSGDAIKLTLAPLSLEERSRIWHAIQKPYRLSVTYEARVVNLDPTDEQTVPAVAARELLMGTP